MINWSSLYDTLDQVPALRPWLCALTAQVKTAFSSRASGNWPKWREALTRLPQVIPSSVDLDAGRIRIGQAEDADPDTLSDLEKGLRQLHPWRKGPFLVFGIPIDTEWRSDWKWDRLKAHIQPLAGRRVLDVGCGNGYHCWRMAGAGAKLVIGIDPYLLYVVQFEAIRQWVSDRAVHVLPVGIESLPGNLAAFDTVFSMGVLSHRRSPLDHLLELRGCLRSGGELALETLVIESGTGQVFVPVGRYAKMRNVWSIPSCPTLIAWLDRCGFTDVRLIDVSRTTPAEQRSTDWMTFESLSDYLDPENPELTVEGHPAPRRAIFLAAKP